MRGHIFLCGQWAGFQLWTATKAVEFSLLSCSEEVEVSKMGFLVTWVNHLGKPKNDGDGRFPLQKPSIETENKFVNELFNHLQENNDKLAIENEDLKKNLALAEERQKCYSTSGAPQKKS
ncbi:hypothetical protein FPHYL_6340 [Fusarium phyllophilum]|uniref:Uncharacterized protein n=1 Tax=Fusarium phyllophilum TaxID=47803 RepID=A0A8H5JUP3_9HYPO|nr:hypothetical protein FPHYL_6340 [Fusarium phyllophilum]